MHTITFARVMRHMLFTGLRANLAPSQDVFECAALECADNKLEEPVMLGTQGCVT